MFSEDLEFHRTHDPQKSQQNSKPPGCKRGTWLHQLHLITSWTVSFCVRRIAQLHLLAITIDVSSASENGCQLGGYAGGAGAGAPLWFPTFEAKTCVQLDSFKALSEHRITRIRRIGWMSTAILVADIPKSCHSNEGPESVEPDWRFKEKPRFLPLKTREPVPQESTFGPKGPCQGNRVEFHVSNMGLSENVGLIFPMK